MENPTKNPSVSNDCIAVTASCISYVFTGLEIVCAEKTAKCQVLAQAQNAANPLWRRQLERPHKKMSKRHLIKTGLESDAHPLSSLSAQLYSCCRGLLEFWLLFFLACFFAWLKGVAAWVKWGYVICQFVSPKLATNACRCCFFCCCCCCSCLLQNWTRLLGLSPSPSAAALCRSMGGYHKQAIQAFPACHNFQSH